MIILYCSITSYFFVLCNIVIIFKAFSIFTSKLRTFDGDKISFKCCGSSFTNKKDLHRHVATFHTDDVKSLRRELELSQYDSSNETDTSESCLPKEFDHHSEFPWLPTAMTHSQEQAEEEILLFYHYK